MADDPSVCTCGCHDAPPKLIHVAPCCSPCSYCRKRIRNGQAAAHVKACGRKKPPRPRRGRGI